MNQLYREVILDHYHNPRNIEPLEKYTHDSVLENASCGDSTHVQINVKADRLTAISHHTEGCAVSISTASMLSEEIIGMNIKDIQKLDEKYIMKMLGASLTMTRIKCALLPLNAIKDALKKKIS